MYPLSVLLVPLSYSLVGSMIFPETEATFSSLLKSAVQQRCEFIRTSISGLAPVTVPNNSTAIKGSYKFSCILTLLQEICQIYLSFTVFTVFHTAYRIKSPATKELLWLLMLYVLLEALSNFIICTH